jgi:CRP-like cAMP-binding protein
MADPYDTLPKLDLLFHLHGLSKPLRKGPLVLADGGLVVVTSGAIIRCRVFSDGRRQATAVYICGDPVNLRELLGAAEPDAAHFVALEGTTYGRLDAGEAGSLDRYLALEIALTEQLVLSLGQRNATERIAHFFCQLAWKHPSATRPNGLVPLPFTQELLGAIVGLSTVHVNRTIQQLRKRRLTDITPEGVMVHDFRRLAALADFEPAYLHLGELQRRQ